MAMSRDRQRAGLRVVQLKLYTKEIDALVAAGWLPEARCRDHDAIAGALVGLLDRIGVPAFR
jgi:hypothetical protein